MSVASNDRRVAVVRATVLTAVVALGFWVWLAWVWIEPVDDETTVGVIAETAAFVGSPFVVAAAVVAWHVARAARGPDAAMRFLAVATAGRHGRRAEWGAAMRAELAGLADPAERCRFALGSAGAALRTGWGRTPWLVGAGLFVGCAALTFAMSRAMLAGDRVGVLAGVWVLLPVLFAVGLLAARSGRSFRAGLESGLVGLVAALAGILVIAAPEAVTWYREAGVFILDGDRPSFGIAGPGEAVRDALTHVTSFYLLFTAPWPVIGAALGAWRRKGPECRGPECRGPECRGPECRGPECRVPEWRSG